VVELDDFLAGLSSAVREELRSTLGAGTAGALLELGAVFFTSSFFSFAPAAAAGSSEKRQQERRRGRDNARFCMITPLLGSFAATLLPVTRF
jgi:hypothetical protein